MTEEVKKIALELCYWAKEQKSTLSLSDGLKIAAQIQQNRVLSDAFMLGGDHPSVLEAIAMELGASKDGSSIKDAIYSLTPL